MSNYYLCVLYVCVKRRIRHNLGVSSGLVGCIESLRIASPRLNVEYDLYMPGSEHIESAHGIRQWFTYHDVSTYLFLGSATRRESDI